MEHNFAPAGMDTDRAARVSEILRTRLSDLIDLALTLKHIHWNVVGNGFMAVHKMMDEQTDGVRNLIDAAAERISALGGIPAGLAGQVVEHRTADDDYALGRAPVAAHLGALDKVYEKVGSGHRDAIDEAADLDPVTEDLLVGQTAVLEMYHWFVRAHIQDVNGQLATEGTDSELDAASASASAMGSATFEDTGELAASAAS